MVRILTWARRAIGVALFAWAAWLLAGPRILYWIARYWRPEHGFLGIHPARDVRTGLRLAPLTPAQAALARRREAETLPPALVLP